MQTTESPGKTAASAAKAMTTHTGRRGQARRVVLISGANRCIGAAVARHLARAGAGVALGGQNGPALL